MLRFDNIVYGPLQSRRLGSSLGVNLLPAGGKLCSFDCIYCECGWNKDGRTSEKMPALATVKEALERSLAGFKERGQHIDNITFAGHGEPTLNPDFPAIIDATIELRDKYCPDTGIAVLSNALTLDKEDIVAALKKVDSPIMKFDAPTTELMNEINRPNCPCTVESIVELLKVFNGAFIMQTMFLGGARPDYTVDKDALEGWMDIVRTLRPRSVMVYTLDRPAPAAGLRKLSNETMRTLLQPLLDEGLDIRIY